MTQLKPLAIGGSLALFGVPALAVALSYYLLRPFLQSLGWTELVSYLVAVGLPLGLLVVAALVNYRFVEGLPWKTEAFSARMRYPKFRLADLFWGIGVALVGMGLGFGVLGPMGHWLVLQSPIALPHGLPLFDDPNHEVTKAGINAAAGGEIRGQRGLPLLYLVVFVLNIAGEELWWRGTILPRQELVFGRFSWIVHGLLWMAFHAFKWWDYLSLLPVCLLIPFVAQRRQSNWAALIAHAIVNSMGLMAIILAVAGVL